MQGQGREGQYCRGAAQQEMPHRSEVKGPGMYKVVRKESKRSAVFAGTALLFLIDIIGLFTLRS
jgi:hypothetical protein